VCLCVRVVVRAYGWSTCQLPLVCVDAEGVPNKER